MKILLINANPVVSRLLALCTRDAYLLLDEVTDVEEVKDVAYDLVFVDDGAYVDAVGTFLKEGNIRKKIFISYSKEHVLGFDESIQKPFLPSQIRNVIESVDSSEVLDEPVGKHFIFPLASEDLSMQKEEVSIEIADEIEEEEAESIEDVPLNVLDGNEIEKIKALLEMDDIEPEIIDFLNDDEIHIRKVEVIKEQLIADGLEILDEDEIIQVLSGKTKEKKAHKCKKNKLKHKTEQKKKQAMLECSKEELYQLEAAVTQAIADLKPKSMKKFLKGKEIELKIKLEDNDSC